MGKARDFLAKYALESNVLYRVDNLETRLGGRWVVVNQRLGNSIPGASPFDTSEIEFHSGTEYTETVLIPPPLPLSTISPDIGLIQAGEFRAGNGAPPGAGFSGVRIGYPAFTYDSEDWNVAGVNNDTLQFGLRASDGAAVAGGQQVLLDSDGISIVAETANSNKIKFVEALGDTTFYGLISTSIAGADPNKYGRLFLQAGSQSGGAAAGRVELLGHVLVTEQTSTTGDDGNSAFYLESAAHTNSAASTERIQVWFDLTNTVTFNAGNITTQRAVVIEAPTYAFESASTITTAATFYIDQAPQAGSDATITTAYALWVDAGASKFDGTLWSETNFAVGAFAPETDIAAKVWKIDSTSANIYGVNGTARKINNSAAGGNAWGLYYVAEVISSSSSTTSNVTGIEANCNITSAATFTTTASSVIGLRSTAAYTAGGGTIAVTNAYGMLIDNYGASGVTTAYGLHISTQSGATTNYALYTNSGKVRFGDITFINDTTNAQMTTGLTINQGTADNEILTLKSDDVAHGFTDITETDTYGRFMKVEGTSGGLQIEGYKDADGTAGLAIRMQARIAETVDTTKSTAGVGAFHVVAQEQSGASITTIGANGNLAAFANSGTTRFILDGDGDSHQDVGTAWTNFSIHDDVALLKSLSVDLSKPDDPIRMKFGEFLSRNREELENLGIVTFNDNKDGHAFINWSKTKMLMIGAIIQAHERIAALEQKLLATGL